MRYRGKIIISIASIVLAFAVGYYLGITGKTSTHFDWKELSTGQNRKGYGFTSEALFNSDIRLPEIKKLSGKAKFIEVPDAGNNELNLGYVVSVDVEKLDLQKLPEKYKVEHTKRYKAGEFMWAPIEEVVYSISFTFKLKDKDGFELVTLKSPSHSIYSGKVNTFQDVVTQSITPRIAHRVSNIVMEMTVEKCETCR